MKTKWKEVLFLSTLTLVLVKCDFFSIVGSAILRPNEPYKVAITSHDDNSGEELDMKISIKGVADDGEVIDVFQNVSLEPGSSRLVKLEVSLRKLAKAFKNLNACFRSILKTSLLFCSCVLNIFLEFDRSSH